MTENKEISAPHVEKRNGGKALRILMKLLLWCVGGLLALLLLIMCGVAWILTPERLTPLVEKYASEYLKADVKADRIELTVWSSFPRVELDVSNLDIVSRALDSQPDSVKRALPADASKLLRMESFHGSINPWSMLRGCINLGDIAISGLGLNLVSYSDSISNFDILPPSEPEEEPGKPWRIELGSIRVTGDYGIRYFDAASDLDLQLKRPVLNLNHREDQLAIDIKTPVDITIQGHKYISNMPLTVAGDIVFNQDPITLSSKQLRITAWAVALNASFDLDLSAEAALKRLDIDMPPVQLLPLIKLLLPELTKELPALSGLDSDLALGMAAHFKNSWKFSSPCLPDILVDFNVPVCKLAYRSPGSSDEIKLESLQIDGSLLYKGAAPEQSLLTISRINAAGEGIDLALDAEVSELLAEDPILRVSSRGNVDVSRFSSLIPLPGTRLFGTVDADASLSCRLSDLLEMRLHNLDADGKIVIKGLLLSLPVLTTELYSRLATFTFGSQSSADIGNRLVAGLLKAQVDIDTLYCAVPGITLGLRDVGLRAGTSAQMLSEHHADEVMPLGIEMTAGRVVADSETDTTHITVRDLLASGRITRFEGNARSPLLQAMISAERLRYADPLTRLGMRGFSADMKAHLRKRNSTKTAYQRRYDAIAAANPSLSADSVAAIASAPTHAKPEYPVVDMSVDNGLKALIRQWGVTGGVRADRVNLTHIMYPVRTRITNLALDFSLDSLRLHRAYVVSQNNRLSVSGTVGNLRQAMLGRTRRPLQIRFFADIDSLDINQIAYNYDLGRGLQLRRGVLARINPEDEDALVRAAAEAAVPGSEPIDTTTLIIPRNIDAQINLTAREALYTNIALHNLRGKLVMNDGAVSIDSLVSGTDFGQAYMNLLYSSRDIQDLNMSVDLGFNRVNLSDFYTTFPQVVEMMPIITNLEGMVGASLTGSFDLFPNMDIDMGSINAVLNISGTDLAVTQDPLIKKVAHMMLIRKKGKLDISDMNIQVAVHDNVMRLYPFAFSMEKYKFALLGENDFDENMYYHLSVLKSPIPWKFGINIKGTFDKPKFRFGGAKYKENEAREVVNIVQTERVNFVKAMRLQLHKLINRAALSYADRREPDRSAERLDSDSDTQTTEFSDPASMMGHALSDPITRALGKNADLLRSLTGEGKKKDKKK